MPPLVMAMLVITPLVTLLRTAMAVAPVPPPPERVTVGGLL